MSTYRALTAMLLERGDLPFSGRCMVRISPGRIYTIYHDRAPYGASACPVCGRAVLRGLGHWWAR
jgi:hypothetical protein